MASSDRPSRLRNACFTINNWTEEDVKRCNDLDCKYMVFGKEGTESGQTPHLQGYFELSRKVSFNVLRLHFEGRAHIESRRGTAKQAADYCMKEGEYVVRGELSAQGKRNDLVLMYEKVKDGASDLVLQEYMPAVYARCYKAIDRMRLNLVREEKYFAPVEVLVFVGPPGSGKTRKAYEVDPDLYFLPVEAKSSSLWWDGYFDQQTVLIDDYYGDLPWSLFLRLLDGYKFNLPIKGGFVWKRYRRVIITSNAYPNAWYGAAKEYAALERRINEVRNFPEESSVDTESAESQEFTMDQAQPSPMFFDLTQDD